MARPAHYAAALQALCLLCPSLFARTGRATPQEPSPHSSSYEATSEGLRLFLESAVQTAGNGDALSLARIVNDMRIPNYGDWFNKTFGKEAGNVYAAQYREQLDENSRAMQQLLLYLAQHPGSFVTRELIPGPEVVDLPQIPIHVFLAQWKYVADPEGKPEDIGHFVFVGGKFRWKSTVRFARLLDFVLAGSSASGNQQPGDISRSLADEIRTPGADNGKATAPTCVYCPKPTYSDQALSSGYEGTMVLQTVIETDGRASIVDVIRAVGHGLDDVTVGTMRQWRFTPAKGQDGQPVRTLNRTEMNFRILPK